MHRLIEKFHGRYIIERRTSVLSNQILEILPARSNVLDVGCGDGRLMARVAAGSNNMQVRGVDVVSREQAHIPVDIYNGRKLPFADNSHDAVVLIDVLHHASDIKGLLMECNRVGRDCIIIKDHLVHGRFSRSILELMDRIGNRRFNVCLDCKYLSRKQWQDLFMSLGLTIETWTENLGLYPFPLSLIFDRQLHFLTRLRITYP